MRSCLCDKPHPDMCRFRRKTEFFYQACQCPCHKEPDNFVRRFRKMWRHHPVDQRGVSVWQLGARFGYRPCTKAYFISLHLGVVTLDLWHGLPSLKEKRT